MRRGLWGPLAGDQRRSQGGQREGGRPAPSLGRPQSSRRRAVLSRAEQPPGTQWGRRPDARRPPDRGLRLPRREVTSSASRLAPPCGR